jgi:competence CoiA-like predicted nuclease
MHFQDDDNLINIARENKDILLKRVFKKNYTTVFGMLNILDDKNVKIEEIPTEIATIETVSLKLDTAFILNNELILDIEFDSTGHKRNLLKYLKYAIYMTDFYSAKNEYSFYFPVKTIIIYPGYVKLPPIVKTNIYDNLFSIEQISLGGRFDGETILAEIRQMFAANPNLVLSKELVIKLVLATLGQAKGDINNFADKVLELARSFLRGPENEDALALVV